MSLVWSYGGLMGQNGREALSIWMYETYNQFNEDTISGQDVARAMIPRDIFSHFYHYER